MKRTPAGARTPYNRNFRWLYAGSSISLFGSRVTMAAMPLTAIMILRASAFQVGLVATLQVLAFLLVGLPVGAWVDRMRKRLVLIVTDIGRAALIASIPVTWHFGVLTMYQLYVVAFLHGLLTVFFDVAYQSFLTNIIGRARLVHGNARLQMVESAASVAGRAIAGAIIQTITAPGAMVVDALSFLASASAIRSITDTGVKKKGEHKHLGLEIMEGIRFVLDEPRLRGIAACTATFNLFYSAQGAILVFVMARNLGFSAGIIGLYSTIGAIGALLGAVSVTAVSRRLDRDIIWVAACVPGLFSFLIPLIGHGWHFWIAGFGQLAVSFGIVLYNVSQVSFRQSICPDRLLGRMNATMRFFIWGAASLGGLMGGAIATAIGATPTLLTTAAGMSTAFLWVFFSPLRSGPWNRERTADGLPDLTPSPP